MAFGHLSSGRAARLALLALSILAIIFTHSLIPSTDNAFAAQATVAWDPGTDPALAGYKVYWGTVSKNYSWSADTSAQTTYTVPSLSEGATYYFAATAYDAARTESGFSNEVTYTVPSACTYTAAPASQSFGAGGGTGTINVTAGTGCAWTTSNGASWISVISGANGTGSGKVSYSVGANTGTASRFAGFTIAGQTFTVSQAGTQTYTLGVTTSGTGNGTVTSSPTGTTFNAGTSVTLTATPGANSAFAGWSGACTGAATTCTVTMNSNLSVAAAFNAQTYTIAASAGTGGSISPSGSVNVNAGANQTFTISPASGYAISSVSVDGTSMGKMSSYAFSNITASHTINASFTTLTYTLSISKSGTGNGTVTNSPTGTSFPAGTSVNLTAAPDANSTFGGWSGGCTGTGTSSSVIMNSNMNVTATFNAKSSYTITSSAGTGGSISPLGSVSVSAGASQTFTISPASGYAISSVTVDGASVGAISSYTFSGMTANHTIQASFVAQATSYTLNVGKSGSGSGTATSSPTGTTFNQGTSVTLTANADKHSAFGGWSGACSGSSSTCTVVMLGNATVTAIFNSTKGTNKH